MGDGDGHSEIPSLELKSLRIISALGRGAKGVVFLVRTGSPNGECLALKVISKATIEKNGLSGGSSDGSEYRRIHFEKEVLSLLQHPLLPRLRGVVETDRIVGYAIDYCPGRDLHSLRKNQTEKMFSEGIIRFYAAELALALEHLHGLGIVYRDLKPENVMIQENGHLMLVDFDLSTKLPPKSPQILPITEPEPSEKQKKNKKQRLFGFQKYCHTGTSPEYAIAPPELSSSSVSSDSGSATAKSNSFVGTEEYLAPEIIQGNGHDFAVDWWCLGVVLYEMLYGTTPFKGSNRKETFYRILSKSPDLVGEPTPLRDLIRKLLEKDPQKRISLEEIKGHDFFRGVDWDLISQIPRPPYIPTQPDDEDMKGNKEIDVELFVQGVFRIKNEDKSGTQNNGVDDKIDTIKTNNGIWFQGLNRPHDPNPNPFVVF